MHPTLSPCYSHLQVPMFVDTLRLKVIILSNKQSFEVYKNRKLLYGFREGHRLERTLSSHISVSVPWTAGITQDILKQSKLVLCRLQKNSRQIKKILHREGMHKMCITIGDFEGTKQKCIKTE